MKQVIMGHASCPRPSLSQIGPIAEVSATCELGHPAEKTKVLVSKAPSGAAPSPTAMTAPHCCCSQKGTSLGSPTWRGE
ncbi:hypothetical protein BHE74_00046510 [Ensete ventricosum]|nr:hypothetical protein BHE74_00046510 [Ensete ventricosum]